MIDENFPNPLIPVLEKDLGIHIDEIRLPKTGMWKSTFLASGGNLRFVVRLEPMPAIKLQRATSAQKRAAEHGVPVPHLLAQGVLQDNESLCWTAEEFAEGGFYYPSIMETPVALAASYHLGKTLRKIHENTVEGFGDLALDCRSAELPEWGDWIEGCRKELATASALADLSAMRDEILGAIAFLEESPPQRAVLCHGDYADDNVLLTPEGKVSAVIDWNNCLACDPAYDLAYCYMWPQRLDCLRELFRGYDPEDPDHFWLRIRAHRILLLVYFIVWSDDRNSPEGVASFAATLSTLRETENENLFCRHP